MSTKNGGKGGAIVNVSSMAATIGGRPGAPAYAASKGAVDAFTKGFAREVAGEGIRVNLAATRQVDERDDLEARLKGRARLLRAPRGRSIPMHRVGEALRDGRSHPVVPVG